MLLGVEVDLQGGQWGWQKVGVFYRVGRVVAGCGALQTVGGNGARVLS